MVTSLRFFDHLHWLDGRPLLDMIEPYRRDLFTKAPEGLGRLVWHDPHRPQGYVDHLLQLLPEHHPGQ